MALGGGKGNRCEPAVNGQSAGTDPTPWLPICPSEWVTWFLGASASQAACGGDGSMD